MIHFFKILSSVLLFIFLAKPHYSQELNEIRVNGIPYIQNIHIKKYGIENKNVSIVQDTNGILFIGNSNGILEYNGHHWELFETKGVPELVKHKGEIYAGAYNTFGQLVYERTKPGIVHPPHYQGIFNDTIGQINNLYSVNDKLVLSYKTRIIILTDSSAKTVEIKPSAKIFSPADSVVYIFKKNEGLFTFNVSEFQYKKIIDGSKLPGDISIMESLSEDSILLAFEQNKGLGFLTRGTYKSMSAPLSDFLTRNQITITDICVQQDKILIGTQSNGLIVSSSSGQIYEHLNEDHGLFDAKVNKLFIDRDKNLWVLHDGGLSRIEIFSGLTYYNHPNGVKGNINSIKKFNDKYYLTTSKGVYILGKENKETRQFYYRKVKGLNTNCYDLYNFSGDLMVSSEDGIFKIQGDQAFLFYNKFKKKFKSVLRYENNPNILLIAKENGLSAIKYVNGLFIYQGDIKGLPYTINSITEDEEGRIWLSALYHGVIIIQPFSSYSSAIEWERYSPEKFSLAEIKWKKLYSTSRGIYISTSKGLYQFNSDKNRIYRDTAIPEIYASNWIFPIIEDDKKNIWFNIISQDKIQSKTLLIISNDGTLKKTLQLPINRIQKFTINTIQPEKEDIVWVGGTNGLIRLDISKMEDSKVDKMNLLIHKITTNNDSILSFNYHEIKTRIKSPKLSYSQNNIEFEFAATDYLSENNIVYSTILEGHEETWSEYTIQNFKEYRNLREGEYVFKVKSKNIYGTESNLVEFPFKIEPPIYRTWYAYTIYLIFIGFLLFLTFKLRAYFFAKERFKLENIINERTEEVLLQKEKADNLIERLLPKETVKELKSGRKAGPYHYNMVTVLFGDIKGFTKITENIEELNAMELLDKLDQYFLEFDSIVEKYNIEKIKTIGDAYMCAGGIPEENHTNPVEVIVAAMEMQAYMKKMKEDSEGDKDIWDLRIGVDTGPIIAGVIGRSKVTYDIWGTTVNMASRMEASGEPGKINITGNTFMLVKDFFICKYRGKMPVKNKGDIDMYFVENFKPQFTETLKGLQPNRNFHVQLQLLRFNDLEEVILEKLDKGLPEDLYYHNLKHTIDVVTQVELIGKSENITDEELLLLKTAALFHDMGHIINYDNHEEEGVKIANRMLPKYGYSKAQIDRIAELILVTKMPPQPNNQLEKIICDADLDYLGRTDFVPVAYNLYKELRSKNKIDSFESWKKVEIEFIKQHSYYTKTARNLREVNKRKQLEKIMKEMKADEANNKI